MNAKVVSAVLMVLLLSGCSTMKPIEMTPEQVQQKVSAGEVLSVGDRVKIATSDDQVYKFKVTAITDTQVLGDGVAIPIDEIVAIESKEFSVGKTAAFAGGTVVLWAIIVAVALGGSIAL